jgi:hypothetical protein
LEKLWRGSELVVDATYMTLFSTATRVTMHNGQTARFWTDSWLSGSAPALLFPALFQHSKWKNRTMTDAIGNGNWVRDVIHNISPPLLVDYVMLWTLIDVAEVEPED